MSEEHAPDVLLEEVDDQGICVLTINRPQAMNALDGELLSAIWHSFHVLASRSDVRVVILTAAGERAFCAGADLKERATMSPSQVQQRLRDYRGAFRAIEVLNKPVVCGINGVAFGGGLEIALACDLRVAAEEALVGLTEARLGIIPGAGGTQRLPRLVGVAKAKELIFTGARLSAAQALEIGLVNRVAPRAELLAACRALAVEMVKCAPISLAQAKVAIARGIEVDLESGLELEAQCYAATIPTQDRLEGLAAFAEKRDPVWHGR